MADKQSNDVAGNPTPVSSRWMLDKRLNIAALIGFGLTACTFIWYAAQSDARLASVEARQANDANRIQAVEGKANSLELVQFRLTAVENTTNRIESKVDKLAEATR